MLHCIFDFAEPNRKAFDMDKLKISTRLTFGFAAITLAFLLLAVFTAWRLHHVSLATTQMETETRLLSLA